jgi:hypothetical protein
VHDTLKIYHVQSQQLLVIHPQPYMKGSFLGDILDLLFDHLKNSQFQRIVILDSIYKNNYSTTDSGLYQPEQIQLKYYKTSHTRNDPNLSSFISNY